MDLFSDRFAAKIPWVDFANVSGQTIPPYSVVQATAWHVPDPTLPIGSTFLSPYFDGTLPGGNNIYVPSTQVSPYGLYITGELATPPAPDSGPNGQAARPDEYPQLCTLSGTPGVSMLVGPQSGSGALIPGSAGFTVVGALAANLAPVKTVRGPYLGKAMQAIPSGTSGPVDMLLGAKGSEFDGGIQFTCYNRFGALNTGDKCLFDWVDQGWEVVDEQSAIIIRGALNGRLIKGGNATLTTVDIYGNPQNTVTVFEVLHINGYSYPIGTIVQAIWNSVTQQWEVMQPLPQVMRGALISALSSGGSATATGTDTRAYQVYEVLGLNGGSIPAGTNIVAFFNNDTQQLEVMAAGCPSSGSGYGGSGGGGQ
jgi:hypothetical protein